MLFIHFLPRNRLDVVGLRHSTRPFKATGALGDHLYGGSVKAGQIRLQPKCFSVGWKERDEPPLFGSGSTKSTNRPVVSLTTNYVTIALSSRETTVQVSVCARDQFVVVGLSVGRPRPQFRHFTN